MKKKITMFGAALEKKKCKRKKVLEQMGEALDTNLFWLSLIGMKQLKLRVSLPDEL